MELLLLGTGPASGVKGKGKTARTRSSALVSHGFDKLTVKASFNLLIDCSPDFEKQIAREKVKKIDAVLLTHAHRDATGGIGRLPSEVPIYAEQQTVRQISKRFSAKGGSASGGKKRKFNWHILRPAKKIKIGPFSVTPFRVLHSYVLAFSTFGFRINGLTYASDVRKIPRKSWRYIVGTDVLVLDAAFWFGYKLPNHFSVEEAIAVGKKAGAKKLVLTQIGNTYPPHEQAQAEIAKYSSTLLPTGGRNIILGYDGLRLEV